MAGPDWLQGFLKRHPELSIRLPQATSMGRAVGFNKPQVSKFYDIYQENLESHGNFTPHKVWNMDESGITNVQKPGKVIASTGKHQVGKITSARKRKSECASVLTSSLYKKTLKRKQKRKRNQPKLLQRKARTLQIQSKGKTLPVQKKLTMWHAFCARKGLMNLHLESGSNALYARSGNMNLVHLMIPQPASSVLIDYNTYCDIKTSTAFQTLTWLFCSAV